MCPLTGNDICILVRILGRDNEVHLSRGNRETLSERSIWKGQISLVPRAGEMRHTKLQVEPFIVLPPQDNLSIRVRNKNRQVCITKSERQRRRQCRVSLDATYSRCPWM